MLEEYEDTGGGGGGVRTMTEEYENSEDAPEATDTSLPLATNGSHCFSAVVRGAHRQNLQR